MTVVKQAVVELVLLTLASVGVALAANQIRDKGHIQLTKNYFGKGASPSRNSAKNESHEVVQPPPSRTDDPKGAISSTDGGSAKAPTSEKGATAEKTKAKKLEHDYQTITVAEAHEVLDDPKTEQGLNVFVDAREEPLFLEGHIPGAIQCFPYETQRCLNRVLAAAQGAEKVIVYCGGGDCEDSIYMCRELVDAGVPEEAVYLFEGGWKEWAAKGLHSEMGSE